jgi:hypothetical protein
MKKQADLLTTPLTTDPGFNLVVQTLSAVINGLGLNQSNQYQRPWHTYHGNGQRNGGGYQQMNGNYGGNLGGYNTQYRNQGPYGGRRPPMRRYMNAGPAGSGMNPSG